MLLLLSLSLLIGVGSGQFSLQKPVIFTNPPAPDSDSSTPVWPAQSKQRLEWDAGYSIYAVYAIQDDVPEDQGLMYQILYTQNSSRHNTFDWTVDIPSETIALSPAFYIAITGYSSMVQAPYVAAYFNVSDPHALLEPSDAPVFTTHSSSSTPTSSTISQSSSQASLSSSSVEPTTSTAALSLSSTVSTTSAASSAPLSTSQSSPLTQRTTPHSVLPTSIQSDPPVSSTATTARVDVAAKTGQVDASIHHPHQNDLGIWIGISLGLGLPLLALAAAGSMWALKRRGRGAVALRY